MYLLATLLGTYYQQGASFIQSYNHVPLVFIMQLLFHSITTVFSYSFFYLIAAVNFYLTAVNMRQWKCFVNHEVLHTVLCVCAIIKLCLLWFIVACSSKHLSAFVCFFLLFNMMLIKKNVSFLMSLVWISTIKVPLQVGPFHTNWSILFCVSTSGQYPAAAAPFSQLIYKNVNVPVYTTLKGVS